MSDNTIVSRQALAELVRGVILDMDLRMGEFADDQYLTAEERRDLAVDTIVEGIFD